MSAPATRSGEDTGRGSTFSCALSAELAKTLTLPWTPLILATALLVALLPAVFASARISIAASDGATGRPLSDTTGLALAVVAFMVLAAVVIASGLRSGEFRVAASAIPRRSTLAAAQLTSMTLLVLTASATLFAADAVIRTWTDPSATRLLDLSRLRAGAGFCAATITFTLTSAALTLAVRNVVVPVAILILTPLLLLGGLEMVAPSALALTPYTASTAVVRGEAGPPTDLAAPGGFLVLLAWSALAAVLFTTTLTRRDL